MGQAAPAAALLLLACLATAQAAAAAEAVSRHGTKHKNTTAIYTAEERDEEGYAYGGNYVPNWGSQPFKAKFFQFPYATCPSPYDTFSFVTKIRVCQDTDGFITGIRYFSEHPIRHHDPTTVCDAVGREGATDCKVFKLYTEDWKWRRYRTVTNIRTAKVRDGRDRWRVVYLAFSYSDGAAVEFGTYPNQHGAKIEQWFVKPEPGKVCGLNGFNTDAFVCDAKSGYLQWVKPCGKCIPKPHNYKCDADYCTRTIKKKYKGGYKGDFVEDDLYKDVADIGDNSKSYSQQQQQEEVQQLQQGVSYEQGQYNEAQGDEPSYGYQQQEVIGAPVPQPLKQSMKQQQQQQQQKAADGKHTRHDRASKEQQQKQQQQQQQQQKPGKPQKSDKQDKQQQKQQANQGAPEKPGFKWPFPKIG